MKHRRHRTDRVPTEIVDAFDDLPDAAFFGVMDELGVDLSSLAEDDNGVQPRKPRRRNRASANTQGAK